MGDAETPQLKDVAAGSGEHPSTAWWRSGVIVGLAFALAIGLLGMVWILVEPLTLLLVSIVIAQATSPIVGWLERWLPRAVGVVAVYLAVGLVFAGIGWLVFPPLVTEAQSLVNNAPDLLARVQQWVGQFDSEATGQIENAAQMGVERFADVVVSLPFTVYNSILDFILVIFMSIYWVIASPNLFRFSMSLFPDERRPKAESVMEAMGNTMGGYVRGTVIDAFIVGALTFGGLTLIGIEYALVFAVIAGLGEFLPVVGPIVAAVPPILVALIDSPQLAGIVIVFYLLLQQLESNVLLPVVMRNQADVPPLLSLVAILTGSALGGLLGAVIAIPLAGAVRVLIVRVLAPAEREWTGADDDEVTDAGDDDNGPDGGEDEDEDS